MQVRKTNRQDECVGGILMPGWNLTTGILSETNLSDDEYWALFSFVFSDACKKTNTYKFGLIKALCDQIYSLKENETGFYVSYSQIFERFAENYWYLVLKYKLKQMAYNGRSEYSKIEQIIMAASEKYNIPSETPFESINVSDRERIIKEITKACKKCVIGALYNDFEGKLYSFSLKEKGLILSQGAHSFIARHKMEIEKLNYFSWARFLERINDEILTVKILEKLDLASPKRKDLSKYRDKLLSFSCGENCFYCKKELGRKIHVDHFIPWSFIKSDNLWNFVLACPKCNSKKNNQLMNVDYIRIINERNTTLYDKGNNDVFVESEFCNYYDGLIDKIWLYAKMNGIKENINISTKEAHL